MSRIEELVGVARAVMDEFSVPGTEAQVAQDLLEKKFPEASGGSARVVFAAPKGEKLTDPDNKAAVMESVENASKAPEVTAVQDPYSMGAISKGGRIGFCCLTPVIHKTFQIMGLANYATIFTDEESAVKEMAL